jgi:hypothetical protein
MTELKRYYNIEAIDPCGHSHLFIGYSDLAVALKQIDSEGLKFVVFTLSSGSDLW